MTKVRSTVPLRMSIGRFKSSNIKSLLAEDGYDETLVPLDYERNGQIRDDELFKTFVGPLRAGVTAVREALAAITHPEF